MTTTEPPAAVPVQTDREAAAHLFPTFAPSILSGEMDETENVQAFARHRLAERERCAKVAEGQRGAISAGSLIATAIRDETTPTPPSTEAQGEGEVPSRIEIIREWVGGERYARDYEYCDANFGPQADRILALFARHRLSTRQQPEAGREGERLRMFLEILSKMGGQSDASDYAWSWTNAFCDDGEPDTFNLAIDRGFTCSTHDSDTDHSMVYLTDAGRAYLATRLAVPTVVGREEVARIIAPDVFDPVPFDPDQSEDFIEGIEAAADEALATADRILALLGRVEPFLDQLRRVNLERYEAWVGGADAGIMFDALELGGEVGELLNVVKKLEREERGWRGSRADPADFVDECADVLICLDKLARRRGVDLAAATIAKFNATSDKVGLPHKLTSTRSTAGQPEGALREALEPFAALADDFDRAAKDYLGVGLTGLLPETTLPVGGEAVRDKCTISLAALVAARAALAANVQPEVG